MDNRMMKPITEFCSINMGQSPDSKTYNENGDGIPFYQGNADFGELHPKTRVWCSSPVKIANKDDILISVRAPIGAMNIATEKCCIGRGLASITPNADKCISGFLFYALKSKTESLISQGTGSTFKAISRKVLEGTKIPEYTKEEQSSIAESMASVERAISIKKEQYAELELLVNSRFVEMFGSLNGNEKGLDIVSINELCTLIKDGTHQTPTYTDDKENGFKFLSSKDVMTQKICWDEIKYIPAELHEKLYATIQPTRNDILMSKNGVNYGVAAVNDTDEVFDIYVSLALLRPKTDRVNPVYLRCAINNPNTKRQFDSSIKGIGVPNLHLGEIKKTKVLVPPMSIQNEFVAFVEQVEKAKQVIKEQLEQLEILKKTLMQKYFG